MWFFGLIIGAIIGAIGGVGGVVLGALAGAGAGWALSQSCAGRESSGWRCSSRPYACSSSGLVF